MKIVCFFLFAVCIVLSTGGRRRTHAGTRTAERAS